MRGIVRAAHSLSLAYTFNIFSTVNFLLNIFIKCLSFSLFNAVVVVVVAVFLLLLVKFVDVVILVMLLLHWQCCRLLLLLLFFFLFR